MFFRTEFFVRITLTTPVELITQGKLPALSANVRLGWKRLVVTNTLAYYGDVITTVKSFTRLAPGNYITMID